eukprot:Colp12_sorted_trinity150504_noHs@27280
MGHAEDVKALMDMGFPENRSKKALAITKGGVQEAMDWIFAHMDDADIDEPLAEQPAHDHDGTLAEAQAAIDGAQARSLKCSDCGKLLRSELEAEAHAARTQHTNFEESTEEIKPLTEEEKKEQLARIQQLIAEKRKMKAEEEKKEQLEKEKLRRKQGQESTVLRQKLAEDEIKRAAEAKKREKQEELEYKKRLREEIARDKAERAAKLAGTSAPAPVPAPAPAAAPQA